MAHFQTADDASAGRQNSTTLVAAHRVIESLQRQASVNTTMCKKPNWFIKRMGNK